MYKKIGIGIILCVFLFSFLMNTVMVIVGNRKGKILIEETEDGRLFLLFLSALFHLMLDGAEG